MDHLSTQTTTLPQTVVADDVVIEGIAAPTLAHYFRTMNEGDYDATAALFADDGVMIAPFEPPIEGRDAIAHYLKAEATGMQLQPRQGLSQCLPDGAYHFNVSGQVQTSLFGVNVAWWFVLNERSQIQSVRVKLLASPQELLKLRR